MSEHFWTEDGLVGGALELDGSTHVDISSVHIGGSALTVMAWVRAREFTGRFSDNRIISKATGLAEQEHYVMLSGFNDGSSIDVGRFRLRVGPVPKTYTLIGGPLHTNGDWQHIAGVYDGDNMSLYVDGMLVAQRPVVGDIDYNPDVQTFIGAQPPDGLYGWIGGIDEVKILNRGLTKEEIQKIVTTRDQEPEPEPEPESETSPIEEEPDSTPEVPDPLPEREPESDPEDESISTEEDEPPFDPDLPEDGKSNYSVLVTCTTRASLVINVEAEDEREAISTAENVANQLSHDTWPLEHMITESKIL